MKFNKKQIFDMLQTLQEATEIMLNQVEGVVVSELISGIQEFLIAIADHIYSVSGEETESTLQLRQFGNLVEIEPRDTLLIKKHYIIQSIRRSIL